MTRAVDEHDQGVDAPDPDGAAAAQGANVILRTYRLALLSDPSYAAYHGSANVAAAKVALLNRVNHIYEDESAIRLLLIAGNATLNLNTAAQFSEANGPCGTAPCYPAPTVECNPPRCIATASSSASWSARAPTTSATSSRPLMAVAWARCNRRARA